MKLKLILGTTILIFGATAFADFAAGMKAYKSGDYATALHEWRPIAEAGGAYTQWNLDFMNASGEGIKTAFKWYQLAAGQGTANGQLRLGNMFYRGDGVAQDYNAAFKWYELAAEQGYYAAQFNLGVMYEEGLGVTQDYKAAVKWYQLAAEQGAADAQLSLGLMYATGQGVPRDYIRVHMWWNIAASQGNKEALANRGKVEKMMLPANISKAKQLAKECIAKDYMGC